MREERKLGKRRVRDRKREVTREIYRERGSD